MIEWFSGSFIGARFIVSSCEIVIDFYSAEFEIHLWTITLKIEGSFVFIIKSFLCTFLKTTQSIKFVVAAIL